MNPPSKPIRGMMPMLLAATLLPGCAFRPTSEGSTPTSKTLVSPLAQDMATLDPGKLTDLYTSEVLMNVFETLTISDMNNKIVPDLAEKWEVSPDGKVYTFHIRHGVKFHNGREVRAADFKWSWERALNPATKSTTAKNYLDGVIGVADVAAGKSTDLTGVKAIDNYTLQITIDRPRSFFPGMMSYPTNSVVCREAVEKTGGLVTAESEIGTGPFKFASYAPGQSYNLVANPDYWGGKPKLDAIRVPIILDPDTLYSNYETGAVDYIPYGIAVSRYVQDRDAHKYMDQYKLATQASFDYLVMSENIVHPFADRRVRKAIGLSVNRDEIVRLGNRGAALKADGALPPGLPFTGPAPTPIPYDPAQGRKLLADAGFPGGKGFPTLTLVIVEKSPRAEAMAEVLRSNLQQNLGITVNIQAREAGEFYTDQNSGKLGFALAGWIADYPDPQDFLSTLFASYSSLDSCGYKNPKFDALCKQADAEQDETKRGELYGEAHQILMDDVGVLPLDFPPRVTICKPNITGTQMNLCFLLPHTQTEKH
jgi:ABC-type transport system substrate-binding protein